MERYDSWGRFPKAAARSVIQLSTREDALPLTDGSLLPYGLGRSYGDVCQNDGQTLIDTSTLNKILNFDALTGRIRCEAGVTFKEILALAVPAGWFLPVTPGTQYVTVGGAIANDVHGKNHHRAGTFGCHVERFELLRSDGSRFVCSPEEHAEYYLATIGGLGLTGLITWADIQLKKISSPWIDAESIPFSGLDEFLELSRNSDKDFEYTVSWIDTNSGKGNVRGIFLRGNHSSEIPDMKEPSARTISFPIEAPSFCINPLTVKMFNTAYYHSQRLQKGKKVTHYRPFFYPLDSILDWNKVYGRKGFFEYQCVVPFESAREVVSTILRLSAESRATSGLSVLKTFGDCPSPGLLSFPMSGVTVALDFYYRNDDLFKLFDRFDRLVLDANGRVYPGKDARMSRETFQRQYPLLDQFRLCIDPAFSSGFWRRVS